MTSTHGTAGAPAGDGPDDDRPADVGADTGGRGADAQTPAPDAAAPQAAAPTTPPAPTPASAAPAALVPHWLAVTGAWSWRVVAACAVLAIVVWAAVQVQLVMIALFLGLVITAVLGPVATFLRRWLPTGPAVGLALLVGALGVAGLIAFVVVAVAGQWQHMGTAIQAGVDDLVQLLRSGRLPVTVSDEEIDGIFATITQWWEANRWTLAGSAAAQVGSVLVWFMVIALGVFCAACFLGGGRQMWTWTVRQLPVTSRPGLRTAGAAAWRAFGGYTRGAFYTAVCIGTLAFVLLLALRVPLAGPLAVLVFVGGFIPLIGAPAAMIVAMLVALAANGFWSMVAVGVGIALIGQLEGHVLQPVIMGKHIRLHAMVVGVVVSAGTIVGGLVGAVVAVPVVGVSWAVFRALRPTPDDDPDDPLPLLTA